jgi:hypothetical protein
MRINTLIRAFAVINFATAAVVTHAQTSPDGVWTAFDESSLRGVVAEREISPSRYRTFRLNRPTVSSILESAPVEFSDQSRFMRTILTLPMPDGRFERFHIEHSPVVEPGLAAKYPELGRTYIGRGVDDPTATVRLDLLSKGFHAMVLSPRGTVMIDPYSAADTEHYLTYFKRDVPRQTRFSCDFEEQKSLDALFTIGEDTHEDLIPDAASPEVTSGTHLRTYRLAVAATNEYTVAVGGNTVAGALAQAVIVMNRVNGVYERDLSMRMIIVANNDLLMFAGDNMTCGQMNDQACTSSNDPYSNTSGSTMLGQNQIEIDATIGPSNYDIGHVFSTGGGGVASLRVPCGGSKARGVTGQPNPIGDPFSIDYVAHEMGHQWGANHTMNGCSRNSSTAYEPGSGITIMAYAGICGAQDLANNSIDTFHVRSLEEIVAYSQTGNGNSCAVTTPTGNTPPTVVVAGGPTFNIPKQTPFSLKAVATDPNEDAITYDWQEFDLGASGSGMVPNSDADGLARPIFRPFLPTADGTRTFPRLQHILNDANVPPATYDDNLLTGEILPAISRTMTFQVVARDNRAGGGGINTATATVVVDGSSGPFVVTAPNTAVTWAGNTSQTVTWNVAGTSAAPVGASIVRILFSSDGGETFPTVISAATINDGSAVITVPNIPTTTGRIKVEAAGKIFFDISDVNFTVTAGTATSVESPFDFDGDGKTDLSIFRPSTGQWWWQRSSDSNVRAVQFGNATDVVVPGDYTGDGSADIAIWRPSEGSWFVLRSEDFTFYAFPFGLAGDQPMAEDFDGDDVADPTIFRPTTGQWFINRSGGSTVIAGFGLPGDKPVPGDYDGDNRADLAIFRPSNGQWWYLRSSDSGVRAVEFGSSADLPVPGRYTPDNKTDIVFYRPSNGGWYVLRSEDLSFYAVPFGTAGDIPVPGDYDGDGEFDTAVFRPSNSTWYINRTTAGILIAQFGLTSDKPVPSAFVY